MKRSLVRPAVFGGFDGTSSLLGVIVYLLITHPALIFPTALSGAISSALSMGAGEWLSDSDSGLAGSAVMAGSTFTGAVLPAIPFAFATGIPAVAAAVVLCCVIGVVVAVMQPNRGRGLALAETFGLLVLVVGVTAVCAIGMPGGGGG